MKVLPVAFYGTEQGSEPVRTWLRNLIKKTHKTPKGNLDLARKRKKEIRS